MKKIPLTQGKFALVDDKDYGDLMQFNWYAKRSYAGSKTFYACRNERTKGNHRILRMHVVIFGGYCDHKNRDGLDNRRKNLRKATPTQQAINSLRVNLTGYRGVWRVANRPGYAVGIRVAGKAEYLGYFKDKIQAAKAYDEAAKLYHGEFAVLNFPREGR